MEEKGLMAVLCGLFLVLGGLSGFIIADKDVEIVNQTIVVPGEVQVIEVPGQCNTSKVEFNYDNDVIEKLYDDEITNLSIAALDAFNKELKVRDLKDFVEDSIDEFDVFNSKPSKSRESEVEVSVIAGYKDVEDTLVKVYKEYDFTYENVDSTNEIKGTVIVEGIITYDEDNREGKEYEADLVYSLK